MVHCFRKTKLFNYLGGNGLDFFQADQLTAQYLQQASPSPGLPIAVGHFVLN